MAQALGFHLGWTDQLLVVLTTLVASVGAGARLTPARGADVVAAPETAEPAQARPAADAGSPTTPGA